MAPKNKQKIKSWKIKKPGGRETYEIKVIKGRVTVWKGKKEVLPEDAPDWVYFEWAEM